MSSFQMESVFNEKFRMNPRLRSIYCDVASIVSSSIRWSMSEIVGSIFHLPLNPPPPHPVGKPSIHLRSTASQWLKPSLLPYLMHQQH